MGNLGNYQETIRETILNSDLTGDLRETAAAIVSGKTERDFQTVALKPIRDLMQGSFFSLTDADMNKGRIATVEYALGLIATTLEQAGVPQLAAENLEHCIFRQLGGSFNQALQADLERVRKALVEEKSQFGNRVLESMMAEGIKVGERLEIILRVGAEYNNGLDSKEPIVNPAGYQARYGMKDELDPSSILVYVAGFKIGEHPKLNVAQSWDNTKNKPNYESECSNVDYVEPGAIAVCKTLVSEYIALDVTGPKRSDMRIVLPKVKPWDPKIKARWQSAVNQTIQ